MIMRNAFRLFAISLSALGAVWSAAGQEMGDARAGLAYAKQICAECHAVQKGARPSPNAQAPAFELVANTRGMSETALRVWFQTPHPTMPNLVMTATQKDDVIAYILSLRGKQ
jgi:cytochrome c2